MSLHDEKIRELAIQYFNSGYRIIINTTEFYHVPDLLMISPEGKLLWIEVETRLSAEDRKRFKHIKNTIRHLHGKFKLFLRKTYTTKFEEVSL